MTRRNISSGSPLEGPIGFSRAVRIGQYIAVAGTAPIAPDGGTASPGDVEAQTRRCIDPEWLVAVEMDTIFEQDVDFASSDDNMLSLLDHFLRPGE